MQTLIKLGYLGLLIGSFLASTVVPFSSDALYVGMLSIGGNIWMCFVVATIGNWLGGLTSYWIGYAGNLERIERKFKINLEKLEQQKKYIDKFGQWLSFFAWLPVVGDVFAIALGFYKVSPIKSSVWMFIGRAFRFALWNLLFFLFAEKFTDLLVLS